MFAEQLKYLTLISLLYLFGCANTPKEDHSSVLMEDVIVERTTVRSTTQNPKPKSGGGVLISGDNITVGTIIVNSPNAKVDQSTKVLSVQQSNVIGNSNGHSQGSYGSSHHDPLFVKREQQPAYDEDRDFFRDLDNVFIKVAPSFIMKSFVK